MGSCLIGSRVSDLQDEKGSGDWLVVQQCECAYHYCTLHLNMVTVINLGCVYFTTIQKIFLRNRFAFPLSPQKDSTDIVKFLDYCHQLAMYVCFQNILCVDILM